MNRNFLKEYPAHIFFHVPPEILPLLTETLNNMLITQHQSLFNALQLAVAKHDFPRATTYAQSLISFGITHCNCPGCRTDMFIKSELALMAMNQRMSDAQRLLPLMPMIEETINAAIRGPAMQQVINETIRQYLNMQQAEEAVKKLMAYNRRFDVRLGRWMNSSLQTAGHNIKKVLYWTIVWIVLGAVLTRACVIHIADWLSALWSKRPTWFFANKTVSPAAVPDNLVNNDGSKSNHH